ncbi:hypothetical protein G7Y89_g9510 [Cudoniella acicularis]|uniref:Uncharacterized protein n=1 Tax=Cudoniella acicularis TaxID=354080 RepID=A0A8H4RFH7_9HELO|nr:hypothetical protein G7Y89_g9510 [Cudoniella acicularis]
MSSTELVTDLGALTAKERARIMLKDSTREAAVIAKSVDRPLRSESPEAPPPPPRSDTKSSSKKRADKGKGKQIRGFGNGGDSDSDRDEKKPKKTDGGGAVKKSSTVVDIGGAGPSDRTYGGLSAEELQAMQLRRAIRVMDQRWEAFESHNQECKLRSRMRGPVLIAMTDLPCASLAPSEDLQLDLLKFEKYMEEYKKEALFGHIRDQGMQHDETDKLRVDSGDDHLEDVLLSVEDSFLERCSYFDGASTKRGYSKVARMSLVMKNMQDTLWEEVKETDEEEQGVGQLVARFLAYRCPRDRTFNLLAEQYFRILSRDLMEGVVAQRNGFDVPTLTLVEELKDSRRVEDELTPEYIDWAISVLDHTELTKRCKNWSRDKELEDFLATFKNCRQKFVEDPDDTTSETAISLVLLKGNKLVNTQPVSSEDLSRMGWYRQNFRSGFWRYQVDSVNLPVAWQKRLGMDGKLTDGEFRFDVILKVRMDGEVIGILTGDGDVGWSSDWDMVAESLRNVNVSRRHWALS